MMNATATYDPYSLWPPPVPLPETDEQQIIRELRHYGITIIGRSLVEDRGLHWCRKFIRLLAYKAKRMKPDNVRWFARWCSEDPSRVHFEEIEPKGNRR